MFPIAPEGNRNQVLRRPVPNRIRSDTLEGGNRMLMSLLAALGDYVSIGCMGIIHKVNYQLLEIIPRNRRPFQRDKCQCKYRNK